MLAWAYCRVSGDEQADRGLPVASQRQAIREYAAQHGITITRWFVDEAISAGTDHRDQFQYLMALAHADPPPVPMILFWAWSRFARNTNDAHYWKASLRRRGVDFIDVSGEIPENLPPDFKYVFEALVHWKDAKKLVEQSVNAKRGQRTLALLGYIPSGCRPPRGYRVEFEEAVVEGRKRTLRRWVPDRGHTWEQARQAWRMRLDGASYREIIAATHVYNSAGSLSTFFCNPVYKGVVTFGEVEIAVDPLVTAEEWQRVNDGREQRRGGAEPRRRGSSYLLSGLLHCGLCGAAMAGDSSSAGVRNDGYRRRRSRYYICLQHKRGDCPAPSINTETFEQALLDAVMRDILTPDNLRDQLATLDTETDERRAQLHASLDALQHELDAHERALDNLLTAIESAPASGALTQRLTQRETQRDDTAAQIAAIQRQLADPGQALDIDALRQELQDAIDTDDPSALRHLLRRLIVRIDVQEAQLRITYRLHQADSAPPFF